MLSPQAIWREVHVGARHHDVWKTPNHLEILTMSELFPADPKQKAIGLRDLHDALLQPGQCFWALLVQHRHIEFENSEKRVSMVFQSRCLSFCRPGHPFRDADRIEVARIKNFCFGPGMCPVISFSRCCNSC